MRSVAKLLEGEGCGTGKASREETNGQLIATLILQFSWTDSRLACGGLCEWCRVSLSSLDRAGLRQSWGRS